MAGAGWEDPHLPDLELSPPSVSAHVTGPMGSPALRPRPLSSCLLGHGSPVWEASGRALREQVAEGKGERKRQQTEPLWALCAVPRAPSAHSTSTTIRLIASQTPHPGRAGAAGQAAEGSEAGGRGWAPRHISTTSGQSRLQTGRRRGAGQNHGPEDHTVRCVTCLSRSGQGSPALRRGGPPPPHPPAPNNYLRSGGSRSSAEPLLPGAGNSQGVNRLHLRSARGSRACPRYPVNVAIYFSPWLEGAGVTRCPSEGIRRPGLRGERAGRPPPGSEALLFLTTPAAFACRTRPHTIVARAAGGPGPRRCSCSHAERGQEGHQSRGQAAAFARCVTSHRTRRTGGVAFQRAPCQHPGLSSRSFLFCADQCWKGRRLTRGRPMADRTCGFTCPAMAGPAALTALTSRPGAGRCGPPRPRARTARPQISERHLHPEQTHDPVDPQALG